MKLLVDMNLSPSWVAALADSGQVIAALLQMALELEDGALLTIDTSRTRVRVLPLQSRR
jgi:predicted nuclease of predicted toxin-antitoxin system